MRWSRTVRWLAASCLAGCEVIAPLDGLTGGQTGEPTDSGVGDATTDGADGAPLVDGASTHAADGPGGPADSADGDESAEGGVSQGTDGASSECGAGASSIAYIQSNADSTASSATMSVSLGAVRPHDLLILQVNIDVMTARPTAVSDTMGSVFQSALGPILESDYGWAFFLFYAEDVPGGQGDTVTVTMSSPPQQALEVYALEYGGVATAGALDVTSSALGVSPAPMRSGPRATSFAPELVFGFAWSGGSASPGAGFVARNQLNGNVAEDLVADCEGSYQATASASSGPWAMFMATFRGD